tara:strand:- start:546 stop:1769 length:1224 start_codon:yes stop_codon:yes gene_type:complete
MRKLLAASQVMDEGLQGLIGLEQAKAASDLDAQKFKLLLAQAQSQSDQSARQMTYDYLTSNFTESSKHYDSLLKHDSAGTAEFQPLIDNAFKNLLSAKTARDDFFGYSSPPQTTALTLVEHEMAALKSQNADPSMMRWTPKMRELLEKKYPGLDSKVLDGAGIIWKATQPDATESQKKAASSYLPRTSGAGTIAQGAGILGDFALDALSIVPGAAKMAYTGSTDLSNLYVPGSPVQDYLEKLMNIAPKEEKSEGGKSVLDFFVSPAGASDQIPDDFDELRTNEFGQLVPTDGSMSNITDNFRDIRRDQYGNLVETFATGETSQLLPKSAIDSLRQEDKKSIGSGTGGMLSFADDIKLSRKAIEFIKNLAVYENEYGQEQGRKYVSKEFAKLSEKEQAEVVEYLERQQ